MNTTTPRIGAIVLAGGPVPKSLAHLCAYRALLPLGGRFIIEYILEALAGTPEVCATVAVVPAGARAALGQYAPQLVDAGESLMVNMARGAEALAGAEVTHLLFVTADIPLITTAALSSYLQQSLATGADFTYPIIPRADCEARFPGAKRTYVKIRDGVFTGGNAVFAGANFFEDKQQLIEDVYNARKAPLKLAGILGWGTLARFLGGTADLAKLEGVASRILGAPARAIISHYAELGFDVDKPEDLAAVAGEWGCDGCLTTKDTKSTKKG